jgi:NADH dehydrogenase
MNPINHSKIIIIGAGFGGLYCAKGLIKSNAQVTLIDYHNYHTFQPLLYQISAGFLDASEICIPIRAMFRSDKNISCIMDEVLNIDIKKQSVITHKHTLQYDYLVIATGSRYHYFGHNEWNAFTHCLTSIEEAFKIRNKLLSSFERASSETNIQKRKELLTYVIIGGGPTGVELAGTMSDLITSILKNEFKFISPQETKVILLEAGTRLLSTMPEKLSIYTQKTLEANSVIVQCNSKVIDLQENTVLTTTDTIKSNLIIWAAGVQANTPFIPLEIEKNKFDSIIVDKFLNAKGYKNIFAIGDCSTRHDAPFPMLASVAKQEGKYLAKHLKYKLKNKFTSKPFDYTNYGTMAVINRNSAVADFGFLKLKGRLAWIIWAIAHLYFVPSMRNRLIILIKWLWNRFQNIACDRIIY